MSKLTRILKHAVHHKRAAKRTFTPEDLAAIAHAVLLAKTEHEGEIRVVIENSLSPKRLARGVSPRRRSMEVFAKHFVWDTENNDGILIHVLLADRHVMVVGDRGIDARVPPGTWEQAVRTMEAAFRQGRFREGVMDGIGAIVRNLPKRAEPRTGGFDLPEDPIVV